MRQKPLFEVIVVATMSAGKTTVINALIGKELLHSANEATTATITRIRDKDNECNFSAKAYSYQNQLVFEQEIVDADTLRAWNADEQIKFIDLVGDIQALQNDFADLVVYDTPGPNNSQDDNHEALTMEAINDGNYGLILYVLNATQLGVTDDHSLLEKIKATLDKDSHKEIVFLLNKADSLDEEKDEKLQDVVTRAEQYLSNIGFHQPVIIPTVASYALAGYKMLNGKSLTRSERADMRQLLNNSENNQFILTSTISQEEKEKIFNTIQKYSAHHFLDSKSEDWVLISDQCYTTRRRFVRAILRTGFGVIQHILQRKLSNI